MSQRRFWFNLPTRNAPSVSGSTTLAPATVSGLTLWLEYDYGVFTDTARTTPASVGQSVKGWSDRSGNGYHATEATNPPTLTANGLDFDGTNDFLSITRMTGQFSAGFTYFVVAAYDDGRPASENDLWGSQNSSSGHSYFWWYLGSNGNQGVRMQHSFTAKDTIPVNFADNATANFIITATGNPGATLTAYYNGTQAGTPADISSYTWANIAGAVTEAPTIGGRSQGGPTPINFYDGTIKALLIYNTPLSAGNLTTIHRYLGNKYGITVP